MAYTPPETIQSTEFFSLYFHHDTLIVHHELKKEMPIQDLKWVLNTGIDLLEQHGAVRWLSDNRGFHALSAEDTEWVNTNWLPRAIEAGWKKWAIVVPADIKAAWNMFQMIEEFDKMGVRMLVFTTPEEALEWLRD